MKDTWHAVVGQGRTTEKADTWRVESEHIAKTRGIECVLQFSYAVDKVYERGQAIRMRGSKSTPLCMRLRPCTHMPGL